MADGKAQRPTKRAKVTRRIRRLERRVRDAERRETRQLRLLERIRARRAVLDGRLLALRAMLEAPASPQVPVPPVPVPPVTEHPVPEPPVTEHPVPEPPMSGSPVTEPPATASEAPLSRPAEPGATGPDVPRSDVPRWAREPVAAPGPTSSGAVIPGSSSWPRESAPDPRHEPAGTGWEDGSAASPESRFD
jgi:hypothetical protein